MSEQYVNLANSTTVGSIDGVTNPITFSVQSGDGSLFPATANGNFRVTVCDTNGANAEVMMVTSRATDTFTASRGAGATGESPVPTLIAHAGGSIVSHDITVGGMNQIRSEIGNTGSGAHPTFSRAGDLWLPTDDVDVWRSNGTTYAPFGPLYPFTAPVDPGIWVNQSPTGATDTIATSTGGGRVTLVKTGADGSTGFSGRVKAVAASKSYTLTAAISGCMNVNTFNQFGLILTNGTLTTSLAIVYGIQWFSGSYRFLASKFNTVAGSFNADYFNTAPYATQGPLFLRVIEDATHRTLQMSDNGQDWIQTLQTAVTDFITTTHYGIANRNGNAAAITQMTLMSWKDTTP